MTQPVVTSRYRKDDKRRAFITAKSRELKNINNKMYYMRPITVTLLLPTVGQFTSLQQHKHWTSSNQCCDIYKAQTDSLLKDIHIQNDENAFLFIYLIFIFLQNKKNMKQNTNKSARI